MVCLNQYTDDTKEEIECVLSLCRSRGFVASLANVWAEGGAGATELADLVVAATKQPRKFNPVYRIQDSIENKISAIVKEIYGADGVDFSSQAEAEMRWLEKHGFAALPICIAKTQYSFSDDATLLGAPSGFRVSIKELRLSAGAGFIVAISGQMLTMPGLSKSPAALHMQVGKNGQIESFY